MSRDIGTERIEICASRRNSQIAACLPLDIEITEGKVFEELSKGAESIILLN